MIKISKRDYDGLLYMYYEIKNGLTDSKGLRYKYFFQAYQNIENMGKEVEKRNININELVEVDNECS